MVLLALGLAAAAAGIALLRVFSGMKNGAFYAKGMHDAPRLKPYMENLHRIEAPAWYAQFGSYFVLVLMLATTVGLERGHGLIYCVIASWFLTQGASAAASYWYQAWINHGSGLPDVDVNENPKAEFAVHFMGKDYSFWWSRPWYGKRRRYSPFFGVAMIIAGIAMICFV